ncbi:peptidase S8/S53 domain-containing protein [Zychaea mexicana]|uniref:peptidase S8/S53 domain-containing protein n=1 Tax=Zychaea mexicana TaxID=64656 RepID=UPI0022FDCB66|nr:peptidase S8/S53 domain-containing protein [Zychaea mexicana]KAI9477111.1 peptidase S8/S53 domain-containing protein [Zychaea mexicana]
MTTVDRVRSEDGLAGEGIKIGVIDTGIDYTHPALGGCFGDGCRVAYGHDLVGDDYGESNSSVDPDNDPMDQCDGHGTHVAGIIGAKDDIKGFEGVAPKATLGAWRIFGCNGDTEDDIILMAAEMAMKAGMDVINLSLGGGVSAWQEDPLAVALSNMADQGVFVAVAQGNEGRDGIERTPSPAVGDHVLAVASMDNNAKFGHVFTLSSTNDSNDNDTITYEYTLSVAKGKFPTNHTTFPVMALISNHSSNIASSGCDPILHDLTGYVVLLRRGNCDFGQKAMHAQNAGAVGLLIYSQPGNTAVEIDLERYTHVRIPVGSINGDDGAQMFKRLATLTTTTAATTDNATPANMTIKFSEQLVKIKTGGLPSMFSTWGPDPELHLKPDIAGIGGYVYSTYPQNLGAYLLMSGTSMATPYLSGSIALYMQAKGQKDRSAIVSDLLNTAAPTGAALETRDLLQSPIKQGSGLVQIYDAIHNTVQMEPSKIALNDSAHFQHNATLSIHNRSPDRETFKLTHLSALSINGFDLSSSAGPVMVPTYLSAFANVTFEQAEFELEGNQKIAVTVNFVPPQENTTEHMLYGGYIEVTSTSSSRSARVPYFGSLGNQRNLPILDISDGFPYIGDYYGDSVQNTTYNFTQRDILYLYVRIANPTTVLKSELINATDNSLVGELPRVQDAWLPRNDHTRDNYNYFYQWHGGVLVSPPPSSSSSQQSRMDINPVPTGRYRLRLSGLRILGDRKIKEDWHSWESPEFNVS